MGFASGIFKPHRLGYTGAKLFPGVSLLASGLLRLMRLSRIVRLGKLKKFAAFLRANDGRVMFGVGQGLGDWYVSDQNVSKPGCDFKDFQMVEEKQDLGHFVLIWDDKAPRKLTLSFWEARFSGLACSMPYCQLISFACKTS